MVLKNTLRNQVQIVSVTLGQKYTHISSLLLYLNNLRNPQVYFSICKSWSSRLCLSFLSSTHLLFWWIPPGNTVSNTTNWLKVLQHFHISTWWTARGFQFLRCDYPVTQPRAFSPPNQKQSKGYPAVMSYVPTYRMVGVWPASPPLVFPVFMYGCKSWTIKKAEC